MVRDSSFSASIRFFLPFLWGKKPSNKNRSHGRPEFTRAGTSAVAPGKVSTSTPFSIQALTSRNPGSEIAGVPASLTNAKTFSVEESSSTNCSTILCSLCK